MQTKTTYGLQMVNIEGVTLLSMKYSTFVLACPLMLGLSSLLGLKPEKHITCISQIGTLQNMP